MAQPATARFICRSCRQHLRQLQQSRSFTSTPQRSKTIPSFQPTSSPELDSLLLTYRQKVFTPFALQQYHRDLIYRPSRHQILLNDPGVTVTLSDDEEVKLMPMDPHDKPNKKKSLHKLVDLLELSTDANDWNNLPAFLEGMVLAKEKLPPGWLEMVVRKANEHGRTSVIVRCAEMVKKTGVTLANPAVAAELLLGCHLRAANAGFEGEELEKAYKQAQLVALMMEDKHHCGGKLKEGQIDSRRSVITAGVLLELACVRAKNVLGGKDEDGAVQDNATKAVAISQRATYEVLEYTYETSKRLQRWLPLWAGMKFAMEMGVDVGSAGKSELDRLDDAVNNAIGILEEKPQDRDQAEDEKAPEPKQRRWKIMYNQLKTTLTN